MRSLRPLLAALTLGSLVACAPSEEQFPDAYARAVCSKLEKCDRADYEQAYASKDECVDDWSAAAEWLLDLGDLLGQEYSPSLAADCLSSIRRASCAEFDDGQYECEVFE